MRRRVELSHRGWALLGGGLGLVLAGRLLGTVELMTLGASSLALLGFAALWVRSQRIPVQVERSVRPRRVHVGAEARVDLEVHAGTAATPQTSLTDEFDEGRRAARFLVPSLQRGQRARAAYRLPTDRRGRFSIGPSRLGISDPFGLAQRAWATGDVDEITVCPRVHDLRSPLGTAGRRRTSSPLAASFHAPAANGEEFLTLREYEVGDDLRRIHWRSTARTGELVVRQDETRWQPLTLVLLDTRPDAHDDASFEAAVEAAASVVMRVARSGDPVEVVTTGGRVLGSIAAGRHQGLGAVARVMDELAVVQPEGPRHLRVGATLRPPARRGLLVVVAGKLTETETDLVAGLGTALAPLVLVLTRGGDAPRATGPVAVVDGRPASFVRSWGETMSIRALPTRGRVRR